MRYPHNMPVVQKLVPRRNQAWAQIIPDTGAAISLPYEHVPPGIGAGADVDEPAWAELCRLSAYYVLLDKALGMLSRREHFEFELKRKLWQRERDEPLIERVLAECRRLSYIDDARAANALAAQLVQRGGMGRPRIKAELSRRGCPRELLDAVLQEHAAQIDETAETQRVLDQRRRHFAAKLEALRRKAVAKQPDARRREYELRRQLGTAVNNYLAAQGLTGDEARTASRRFVAELLGTEDQD
jgi:regulatory protein